LTNWVNKKRITKQWRWKRQDMAAYLKGLAQAAQARPDEAAKKRPTHSRRTKHRGEANPANP
jgi:hypothetical protein